jgi:DNA-binding response OmpR family regulator
MANNDSRKKILVADDDPGIIDAINFVLSENGYHVTSVLQGEKVIDMFRFKPDLLLLDIWMSGSDGREICKELKHQESTKDVPIIMISANKDTEQMAKIAGADDFVSKPFEIDDLLEKVRKYVN